MREPIVKIRYYPQWKEVLHGYIDEHRFTIELTMGVLHVYFPTEATWNQSAPDWAKGLWGIALDEARKWCSKQKIPLDVDEAAWVHFE